MASKRAPRRTAQRKQYTVDAFEGIEELRSASRSPEHMVEDDDDEDDFQAEPGTAIGDAAADDDVQSDGASDEGDREEAEVGDDLGAAGDAKSKSKAKKRVRKVVVGRNDPSKVYYRGLIENIANTAAARRLMSFGPDELVIERIKAACEKWSVDYTLPSRYNILTTGDREAELDPWTREKNLQTEPWMWFSDVSVKDLQSTKILSDREANHYNMTKFKFQRQFLAGPVEQPSLHNLSIDNFIRLDHIFKSSETNKLRSGFIVNIGVNVLFAKWAPNQPGQDQYLAVTLLPDRQSRTASAFEPQPPHPTSLQIWRFKATENGRIDTTATPHPCITLCAEMGDITSLEWCQIPTDHHDRTGLLAFTSADGHLRIVDIPTPTETPSNIHLTRFLFSSKPPNTVTTCVSWLSSHRIAAGCANGSVAIWDLTTHLTNPTPNPRPIHYISIATTYITNLTSCYPSHPHLLLTISMSGYIQLLDLRQPSSFLHRPSSTASSAARQLSQPILHWHDTCQSALSFDDNFIARAFPIRRLLASTKIGRFRAGVLCTATSPWHPCVLVGLANGECVGFNPVRRATYGARRGEAGFAQVWFAHEWRRAKEEELGRETGGQMEEDERLRVDASGISRFTEGYKLQHMVITRDKDERKEAKKEKTGKAGVHYVPIYEEATAVTAVAWNPNRHVGGWAVAGMADGLLRVEDIAL